jgi:peptide/nickel transport system permease protein
MPFKPVVLWTDALVFLLVAVVIASAWYIRTQEHLLAPWRKVARSRYGMCALVVLSVFVAIGLLDSLHYRPALQTNPTAGKVAYAVEVRSLFDALVAPLGKHLEKTYSAPFAAYSYSKETVERPDGTQAREFPRLKFGGARLKDPAQELVPDVVRGMIGGVGVAAVLWIVLTMVIAAWLAGVHKSDFSQMLSAIVHGKTELPWRAMLLTVGVILLVAVPLVLLSARYHVLGTDKVGQDVFYEVLKSIRTGLVIGTLTTLVMLPFALSLGVMAGYFGGWVDDAIQYVYTTLNAIPGVLLIAAAVLIMQTWMDLHPEMFETVSERADVRLLFLCLILGITTWTGLCRLLRGETLKLRELEYVEAARAFGVSDWPRRCSPTWASGSIPP